MDTIAGREFQARAAATGNTRSPSVDGTASVDELADVSRRRASALVVRWSISVRYDGAMPCRQRCVRTHNRYCIVSSPKLSTSAVHGEVHGVVCSDLLEENTSRAAAFTQMSKAEIASGFYPPNSCVHPLNANFCL